MYTFVRTFQTSLMFHIDPTDPTPIEAQLVRTLRSAVGAGVLEAGDPLPTVRGSWRWS